MRRKRASGLRIELIETLRKRHKVYAYVPFHPGFILDLKRGFPPKTTVWNKEKRRWEIFIADGGDVDATYGAVKSLMKTYFKGEINDGRHTKEMD